MHVVFWFSSLLLIITTLVVHHKIDQKNFWMLKISILDKLNVTFHPTFQKKIIIATSHAIAY
jgi:hypothetical protein